MARIIANHAGEVSVVVFVEIGMVYAPLVKHIGHGLIGIVIAGALHIIMARIVTLVHVDARVVKDLFAILVGQHTPYIILQVTSVDVLLISLLTLTVTAKTVVHMHTRVLLQQVLQLTVFQDSK
jgi:hypothetical protein